MGIITRLLNARKGLSAYIVYMLIALSGFHTPLCWLIIDLQSFSAPFSSDCLSKQKCHYCTQCMCIHHCWILKEIHMNQEARSSLTCDSCLMIGRWPKWTAYCTHCLSIIGLFNVLCDWKYHYILLPFRLIMFICIWNKLQTDWLYLRGNNRLLFNRYLHCVCDILLNAYTFRFKV